MQSATRRFSPPESFVTSASPGGKFIALHRDFNLAIELPGVRVLDLVLHLGLPIEQLFHLVRVGDFAELLGKLLVLGEQRPRRRDRFLDVAKHVFLGIQMRLLLQKPDGKAFGQAWPSPSKFLSMPAMIRSSVLLPEPLRPRTPIFAPGIEREPDIFEDFALADLLGQALHLKYVFLCHELRIQDTALRGQGSRAGRLPCVQSQCHVILSAAKNRVAHSRFFRPALGDSRFLGQ